MNIVLCVQRDSGMRKLHGPDYSFDGYWFYICAVLGMHTHSRDWKDPPVALPGGITEKATGMLRLHTTESNRLLRTNKYYDEEFKDMPTTLGRLLLQGGLLWQGSYASVIYIRRLYLLQNATLNLDHMAGLYAISGTLVTLLTIILHVQPYEWVDKNDSTDEGRKAMPDIDTSNAWVYEGCIALTMQLATWIGLRLWAFSRTLTSSDESWKHDYSTSWRLFNASFTNISIGLAVILVIGTGLMFPTTRDIFQPHRKGHTWVNRVFNISYQRGAVIIRLTLASLALGVSAATWWQASRELQEVRDGNMKPWNANWTMPNPTSSSILDVIWCLYC